MARDYIIRNNEKEIREQYPDGKYLSGIDNYLLINIKSITYNVYFRFFPYDVKITENLNPEWNKEIRLREVLLFFAGQLCEHWV